MNSILILIALTGALFGGGITFFIINSNSKKSNSIIEEAKKKAEQIKEIRFYKPKKSLSN